MQRVDPVTALGDRPGFHEWLWSAVKDDPHSPYTLIAIDLNDFKQVNIRHGVSAGDKALRWVAGVLIEESDAPVYRIGGDEFLIVLAGGHRESHGNLATRLFERLNREGSQVYLNRPACRVAVLFFPSGVVLSRSNVIGEIYASLGEIRSDRGEMVRVFEPPELRPPQDLRRVVSDMRELVNQLGKLAAEFDRMYLLAHTDALTELPNSRAAMEELETTLSRARFVEAPFCILLVDGDELRRYNEISYAAGDEMLQKLGATQKKQLRGGDFLARWRMGDEFLAIMPGTSIDEAVLVAERIRLAVEQESLSWLLPVTISIGIAAYPADGETTSELLYRVEAAKNEAKARGKNQIVVASGSQAG